MREPRLGDVEVPFARGLDVEPDCRCCTVVDEPDCERAVVRPERAREHLRVAPDRVDTAHNEAARSGAARVHDQRERQVGRQADISTVRAVDRCDGRIRSSCRRRRGRRAGRRGRRWRGGSAAAAAACGRGDHRNYRGDGASSSHGYRDSAGIAAPFTASAYERIGSALFSRDSRSHARSVVGRFCQRVWCRGVTPVGAGVICGAR
jgi:hypothetical protein